MWGLGFRRFRVSGGVGQGTGCPTWLYVGPRKVYGIHNIVGVYRTTRNLQVYIINPILGFMQGCRRVLKNFMPATAFVRV